jgi:hypothetical protein
MAAITISEAIEILRKSKPDELAIEINILNEEISDLKKQIILKRKMIRELNRLAELAKIANIKQKPKTWERIKLYLEHAGPTAAHILSKDLQASTSSVGQALCMYRGKHFEQLPDKKWRLKKDDSDSSNNDDAESR